MKKQKINTDASEFKIIENKKDEPQYKEVSKFVGGMVECVQFPNGDLLLVNEAGKLMQLPLNPEATALWRATFDVIDFMPLVTVDYSGGMIVTDWYTDSNTTNDSLKFTIRFMSNEIRADSLKIIIHRKTCKTQSNCIIKKITSTKLEETIRSDIIRKAALLDEAGKDKKKKKKN